MIDEVVEGLFGDGDAEFAPVGVIGLGKFAGAVQLREENFLGRTFESEPPLHPALQGARLAVRECAGKTSLENLEGSLCLQPRVIGQLFTDHNQ